MMLHLQNKAATKRLCQSLVSLARQAHTNKKHFEILIVGGGAGGMGIASWFSKVMGKGKVGIIDPSSTHYYQPMLTLVGSGHKRLDQCKKPQEDVIPKNCEWIKQKVVEFNPDLFYVTCDNDLRVCYDYLVVAIGMHADYGKVKGLENALQKDPQVCSNYSPLYVNKTHPAIESFSSGDAIFTFPNTPVKCAGAPQKIMYLAEYEWNKSRKKTGANVSFYSALDKIFAVPKYADLLTAECKKRYINVNFKKNLVEVDFKKGEAVFENLEGGGNEVVKYKFLHVTPPMSPPEELKNSPLADANGYMDVNQYTMQHVKYDTVFGCGDCTNAPTSKTAAAAASQGGVIKYNIDKMREWIPAHRKYNGYTSCPLLLGGGRCLMAEFNYDMEPYETLPFDQAKFQRLMYFVKKTMLPAIYWQIMLKGYWNGPDRVRRMLVGPPWTIADR